MNDTFYLLQFEPVEQLNDQNLVNFQEEKFQIVAHL